MAIKVSYQKPWLKSMAHAVHPRSTAYNYFNILAHCVVATQREQGIVLSALLFICAHHKRSVCPLIGGAFLLESIIWCSWIVRYPEFGGCPLFGSSKCIVSMGIAVAILTVVCYIHYWECPLKEVPLYIASYPDQGRSQDLRKEGQKWCAKRAKILPGNHAH